MKGKLLYQEDQKFVGTWTFYLIVAILLLATFGSFSKFLINSTSNENLIAFVITALVLGGITWLFVTAKFEKSIDDRCIYYRYTPFISKERVIEGNQLKDLYVRKYKPLLEYGGWGVRGAGSHRALNVSGNMGLQLIFKDGKKILLGSRKPEELRRVVKQLKIKWNMNG